MGQGNEKVTATANPWTRVDPSGTFPLRHLEGKKAGPYLLRLSAGPRSRFGASYFRIHLENSSKQLSTEPVILGLCGRGPHPSQNWIEVAAVAFSTVFSQHERPSIYPDNTDAGWRIWRLLGDSIPPGGHLMVEYESPEWSETALALVARIPPAATMLGYLLHRIGCGVNFKDWYYSEGLHEGPRKLQGWKAINEEHRRRRAMEIAEDLNNFLAAPPSSIAAVIVQRARRRAEIVLSQLSLQAAS